MSLTKIVALLVFFMLNTQFVIVTWAAKGKVDILQNKLLGMEQSLTQDIELLRIDMKTISSELSRMTEQLTNVLSRLEDGVIYGDNDRQEPENVVRKQAEIETDLNVLSRRFKRAFSDEKSQTRLFMSELRSEIEKFGKQMAEVLTEVKESQIKSQTESVKILTEHTSGFMTELKQILNDLLNQGLKTSLQSSFQGISSEINDLSDRCRNDMQAMSQKLDKNTIDIRSTIRRVSVDVSQISDLVNVQKGTIEGEVTDKLNENNVMLNSIVEKVKRIDGIYARGKLRLVNVTETEDTIGGRLEVFYSDKWGTVCDDDFGMTDAHVACRALGFKEAVAVKAEAYFGLGVNDIWMDDVQCEGSESCIFNCERIGAGKDGTENCHHKEDVGVICNV